MKKLNNYINRLYRLSLMKEVGIITLLGIVLVGVLTVYLAIFTKDAGLESGGDQQHLDLKATHVKNNNAYFHKFMENIRNNDGILILGTSESGSIDGYNYWELLNADREIQKDFSVFYGAGRFCEMYFPLIVSEPELWRDQELLVFVNPTYWRVGLNESSETYQERYLDKNIVEYAIPQLKEEGLYATFFEENHLKQKVSMYDLIGDYFDDHVHTLFYRNLGSGRITLFNEFTSMGPPLVSPNRINENTQDDLKALIDLKYNCTPHFMEAGVSEALMPVVDTASRYRYDALEGMFKLCEKYNINATYIIGPYNGVLAEQVSTEETKKNYLELMEELGAFFKEHKQQVIDLRDLSNVSGTFIDAQHHSGYGGYLIYQRIKKQYD
ncbi:MAG: hypothetical protein QNK23_15765 [Crocinitomicaceae bacterium]|nr:hypothetical protein [Crocinitomicaceae bacterium]